MKAGREEQESPHLHDKALVVAAARLRDQFVFQPAPLLVQLHHGILAVFCQNWSLLFHVLEGEKRRSNSQGEKKKTNGLQVASKNMYLENISKIRSLE